MLRWKLRLVNGTHVGVNVAIGPRGTTDLHTIDEHQAKPILVHINKGICEDAAIGQDRALRGESRHHDVVCGEVDKNKKVHTCVFVFFNLSSIDFCWTDTLF